MAQEATQQHPQIIKCNQYLDSARAWHALYDIIDRTAVRYQMGQNWRHGWDGGGSAAGRAQRPDKEKLHLTPNHISPIVRQWRGRLKVRDWSARFDAVRDDEPEVHLTSRQMSRFYDLWYEPARLPDMHSDCTFAQIVMGHSYLTAYFDDRAPGGLRLEHIWSHRITTDPAVVSETLESHPYVIDSQVLPVSMLRQILADHVGPNDPIWNTKGTMEMMMSGESWLGRALFQMQPGIGTSQTPALILHRMFEDSFTKVTYILQNIAPEVKKGQAPTPLWKVVLEDEWKYGNPYLKLDLFENIISSVGIGLVTELVAPQDILAVVGKHELITFLSRSSLRWFVHQGDLIDENALKKNIEGGLVYLKPGVMGNASRMPQPVTMPKVDASADPMRQVAMAALSWIGGVTPSNLGTAIRSGQPFSALELLNAENSVPLSDVAEKNRIRTNRFINNVIRMGVDHKARTDTRGFVAFIGRGLASPSLARIASDTILNGETKCSIRPASWLAETPEQVRIRLWSVVQAGHMSIEDYNAMAYELTQRELIPGQDEAYQQAHELMRRLLAGQEIQFNPLWNLSVMQRVITIYAGRSLTEEYKPEQIEAMLEMFHKCEQAKLANSAMAGAHQMMNPGASQGGGSGATNPGSVAPPPSPTMQPAMSGAA